MHTAYAKPRAPVHVNEKHLYTWKHNLYALKKKTIILYRKIINDPILFSNCITTLRHVFLEQYTLAWIYTCILSQSLCYTLCKGLYREKAGHDSNARLEYIKKMRLQTPKPLLLSTEASLNLSALVLSVSLLVLSTILSLRIVFLFYIVIVFLF